MHTWWQQLQYRARTLFGRAALERALDDELQFHLEMQTGMNIQLGMSPLAARALAEQQFGGISQHKDAYRDRWGARQLEMLAQDIRSAARHAWSHRATSLAVVAVLALGIGLSTAVFNVVYAVVIHPLPLAEPGRLVRLQAHEAPEHHERLLSVPELRDLRAHVPSLSAVAEFHYMYFILLDGDQPQRVAAGVVSSNFLDVMGVQPALGRTFTHEEELPGADGVIILSHRYWQEHLGADPHVVGRTFRMNDRVHTVVGVLPPMPRFPEEADIYLPTAACPLRASEAGENDRTLRLVSVLGRVAPHQFGDMSAVQRDLDSLATRLRETDGEYETPPELSVVPVHDDLTGRFKPTLTVLVASTGFLLLSLCFSVGGLMMANTLRRRNNLLMMTALGVWRGRLFRQFATEALLLSLAGTIGGLVLAARTVPVLASLASRFTPRAVEIQFDGSAVLFASAAAIVVSLLIGSIVTLTAGSSITTTDALGHRRHVATRPHLFKALVVVHVAVSFALLVGAGLMLRSLTNLERVNTGIDASDVLTMRVSADFVEHPYPPQQVALFRALLNAVQRIPEVTHVAVSSALPLSGAGNAGEDTFQIAGRTGAPRAVRPLASLQIVSDGYFDTVGLTVLQGRGFTADDRVDREKVAVISDSMSRRQFPNASPVGERLRVGDGPWLTIVGVVADARQRLSEPPMDEIYQPLDQQPLVHGLPTPAARLLVRGWLPSDALAAKVTAAIRGEAPHQAVDSVLPLTAAREYSLRPMRVTTTLIGLFAGIALIISAIGLCGVAGASVSVRTRAIGLQMALGATRPRLLASVLREGLVLSLLGLAIGVVLAVPLASSLSGLLFEVQPLDVPTFVAVAALLLATTVVACFEPARRAAMVDPNTALRA